MARPTKPGNIERGWNDPPVFLHMSTLTGSPFTTTTTPPSTLLNKRVAAYPGMCGAPPASGAQSDAPPSSKNTPPPLLPAVSGIGAPPGVGNVVLYPPSSTVTALPGPAPIIIPNMAPPLSPTGEPSGPSFQGATPDVIEVPDFGDDNQMFLYVTSHLKRVHRDCQPLMSTRVSEEVTRKLGMFETMWESGKISYPVKAAMARLSIALCQSQCDLAHEIHMGLVMDYISEVGQWMVGVKRLIQESRNVAPVSSPPSSPPVLTSICTTSPHDGNAPNKAGEVTTELVQQTDVLSQSKDANNTLR